MSRHLRRRGRYDAVLARTALALACALLLTATADALPRWQVALGVYTAPGPKAGPGAEAFERWAGRDVDQVLDFLPSGSWREITRPAWLLGPHAHAGHRLVLSVPLLPDDPDTSLSACAAGRYDVHWHELARNLVAHDLPGTVLRPGWEFNGVWYRWSAAGQEREYVECFRRLVRAARATPGQRFTFDWNPNIGAGAFPAERAYPGDRYVDFVGVDVYDTSWVDYPAAPGRATEHARRDVRTEILHGDHGLHFWREFARNHGKPMSVPEWGVTWRADGHGGGDNPSFVEAILEFVADPTNRVAYANYFNSPDSAALAHDILRSDTRFPAAAARFRELVGLIGRETPRGLT